MTPCVDGFSHQRKSLFKYLFGFWGRRLIPKLYDLSYPHSFQLVQSYKFVNDILKELGDHHDVLGSFAVSLQQLYKWLQGETKDVEIRHPVFFEGSKTYERDRAKLFNLYTDFKIDVKMVSFMWRTAVGGLKTGYIVKKYKIPGARCNCVFLRREANRNS